MRSLSERQAQYYELSSALGLISDAELQRQLAATESSTGWGVNQALTLSNQRIFVKRIPLTAREQTHGFDTSNHYQLPMYYHYGVGSAGFGAYRELISHIRTTNWVLQGESEAFPLLFHYRILPAQAAWKQVTTESRERHLTYWNQSPEIADYLANRDQAAFEIQLFLEYIPFSLLEWFTQYPNRNLDTLLRQADAALCFLNQRGILHLDAHLANLLTDGEQVWVSDFGLALDQQFTLAQDEQEFWQTHTSYDRALNLAALSHLLLSHCEALPEDQQRPLYQALEIQPETERPQKIECLLKTFGAGSEFQIPDLAPELRTLLIRHHETLLTLSRFYTELRQSDAKDTRWPAPVIETI